MAEFAEDPRVEQVIDCGQIFNWRFILETNFLVYDTLLSFRLLSCFFPVYSQNFEYDIFLNLLLIFINFSY